MTKNKKNETKAVSVDNKNDSAADPEKQLENSSAELIKDSEYEHRVFLRIQSAYEEAKRKRETYKRVGPLFVIISGIIFLTLIFTLENKITFLILWVVLILYTVALMIRTEYKYHQFQEYLELIKNNEEAEPDEAEQDVQPPLEAAGTDLKRIYEEEKL